MEEKVLKGGDNFVFVRFLFEREGFKTVLNRLPKSQGSKRGRPPKHAKKK